MTSASDKNKHKEKILEIPDASSQVLEDSHHRQNQALDSDPSMFGSQQTVQAPSASATKFPITQNHHLGGGGGESGKRVIHITEPKSIRPPLLLSQLTNCKGGRIRWTKELHELLFEVMNELGGLDKVVPRTLRQAMNVEGLTKDHLRSRLQKIRDGKITETNWRERQSSKNLRCENSPVQGEVRHRLQTLEAFLDDQNVDTVSPTQQEPYFNIYNSLKQCIRPENDSSAASNGNLPNHQMVNPPDHSAVNGAFGNIASLLKPATAITETHFILKLLQTAEAFLDDQNADTVSPTQQEAYCKIYYSLTECMRPENYSSAASNGNLPNHQMVNPPDHSAVNGAFGDIASLQGPETAITHNVQAPNAIASSPSCAANCLPISSVNASSSWAAYGPTSNANSRYF